jgi:hypothetical protein
MGEEQRKGKKRVKIYCSVRYKQMFEQIIEDHGPFKFRIKLEWQTFLFADPIEGIGYEPAWEWLRKGDADAMPLLGKLLGPKREKFGEVTQHHKDIGNFSFFLFLLFLVFFLFFLSLFLILPQLLLCNSESNILC